MKAYSKNAAAGGLAVTVGATDHVIMQRNAAIQIASPGL